MLTAVALAAATVMLTDRVHVLLAAPVVCVGDVASGAGPVARVVIARLASGRDVRVSRQALAVLIRRAVPGVTVTGAGRGGSIILRAPAARHVARAAAELPAVPPVKAGDRLTLVSRAGPVTVERPVTALQPGRAGRRLFVRDDAGQVSSIRLAAGKP